jgi:hypothetical protein
MDLRPVLHLMHSFLPRHELGSREDAGRSGSRCSGFDRRKVLSFEPASTVTAGRMLIADRRLDPARPGPICLGRRRRSLPHRAATTSGTYWRSRTVAWRVAQNASALPFVQGVSIRVRT